MTSIPKYLYRKAMLAVTLACAIFVLSLASQAQYRAPQPERKTPRAVGVLETFKNGSRRLVPITFFYEKHYYDATFYHATPVPFTLYSETVYEVQQSGTPLGTFTVRSATQNASMWFGNGRFKVLPDPALLAKKAAPPVVIEDSSRPVLHRREGSEGDNPTAHRPAAAPTPGEDDPDRPKLHRREDSAADASAPSNSAPKEATPAGDSAKGTVAAKASGNAPEETSGQDPDRPKLHRKEDPAEGKSKAGSATPTTVSTSPSGTAPTTATTPTSTPSAATAGPAPTAAPKLTPSDDPDHPILRRGQPVQETSGRDLPDFHKEEPVSRQVAISDAGPTEPQPLLYACREEERLQIESGSRELAQAELRKLAPQRGIVLAAPPQASASAKMPAAAKKARSAQATAALPELKLTDAQFALYDLDYNNYPTVVYSARYTPESASPENEPITSAKARSWVVTVVARQVEGKMVMLYGAVSDPRELDLYPEVRLVDALDPEGYGRDALLFREQKRDGVSWLLARATAYQLQPILETPAR